MMKNQLAGLMKQAQQMQDNMKKAQEELARTEVEGQSGAGLVKVVMTCRHDVKRVTIDPSLLARGQGHARGPRRRRDQRRRAPRRDDHAGEDVRAHRGHADAAGLQAAVLMTRAATASAGDDGRRRVVRHAGSPRRAAVRHGRARPRAALPAGRRAEGRAAHGAAPAAARPRRRGAPRAARCSTPRRPSAIASAATRSPRTRSARCAARPKRDPSLLCVVETPADLLMVEQTQAYSGPLLRADGAPVAARRHRPEGNPARPPASSARPTAW